MTHRITNSTHHADNGAVGLMGFAVIGAVVLTALCLGIGALIGHVIWGW